MKIKAAETDIGIFHKELVLEEFTSQETYWLDITIRIQGRIHIALRHLGYLF